jgi:quinone-modifying oxidoreductase subunit QmoC
MNPAPVARYRNDFLKEVAAHVEQGDWVRLCMQCGVCAGSCPLGPDWEHSPQELFMMIRAGKREQVLSSDSMWMCTSCYNCIVRCPRELPITHIMHGLAHYAGRLGLAPGNQPTRKFARLFWQNLVNTGRINEPRLGVSLSFMHGFGNGIKTVLGKAPLAMNMCRTRRLEPMDYFGGHGIKDRNGLRAILRKAREIEAARTEKCSGGKI